MSSTGPYDLKWKRRRQAGLPKQSGIRPFKPPAASGREQDIFAPPQSSEEEDGDEDNALEASRSPKGSPGRSHQGKAADRSSKAQKNGDFFGESMSMRRPRGIPTKYSSHRSFEASSKSKNIHRDTRTERRDESLTKEHQKRQEGSHGFKVPPVSQAKRSASPPCSSQNKRAFVLPPGSQSGKEQQSEGNISRASFKVPKDLPFKDPKQMTEHSFGTSASTMSSVAEKPPLKDKFNPPVHVRDAIGQTTKLLDMAGSENLPYNIDELMYDECKAESASSAQSSNCNELSLPYIVVDSSPPTNSAPPSSSTRLPESSSASSVSEVAKTGKCPLCGALIDQDWLDKTTGGKRPSTRLQAEICRTHKVRTSREAWTDRGYPHIDWDGLHGRLDKYHARLDALVDKDKPSFYRNMLEDNVRTGKYRTLKQTMAEDSALNILVPGYYGSRGARVMVDNIMSRFSTKLRRLAPSDKLISICGVSGYVQAVLAPELAMMLVMEDMDTDEAGAQAVLRESVDVGKLLNDEDDDAPGN